MANAASHRRSHAQPSRLTSPTMDVGVRMVSVSSIMTLPYRLNRLPAMQLRVVCRAAGVTKLIEVLIAAAGSTNAAVQPSCDLHDVCYSTLGKSKEQCDLDAYNDLRSVCQGTTLPNSYAGTGCLNAAYGIYVGISFLGEKPYADAQKETRSYVRDNCTPIKAKNPDGTVT